MNAIESFASRDELADAAADVLARALAGPDARVFAATGGTTVGPTYDRLSARDLDWSTVTIILTDERFVDPTSAESNEAQVRARLLTGRAKSARLSPLKGPGPTPEDDALAAEQAVAKLLPATATLLGMGADGHVASLFPGAADLASVLDPDGARLVVGVDHAGLEPRVPRISLTVRALLQSGLIVVMITGEEKRAMAQRVVADPAFAPPAAAILRQNICPVRILWAP